MEKYTFLIYSFIYVTLTDCFFFFSSIPQKPGTLFNRNSNQLINTTATNGSPATSQSAPAETKPEVNYNEYCA